MKNFENQSAFGKVMDKSAVERFDSSGQWSWSFVSPSGSTQTCYDSVYCDTRAIFAGASSQYVVSLRAFNNAGEGIPIYETTVTRDDSCK